MTSYRYLGYGVTDSNGVAHLDHDANGNPLTHSYTGVGAGEIDVLASLDNPIDEDSIVSGTYEVLDALVYDSCTSDTTSLYYVRTDMGNSIAFSNGSLLFTVGTGFTFVSREISSVSDYVGKTLKFEVDVDPSYKCRLRVYNTINGVNTYNSQTNFTTSATTLSLDVTIPSDATAISFRVDASENNANETVKINNFKIYSV